MPENKRRELLEVVGLPDKADAYPAQLSGGQSSALPLRVRWLPTPRCCCETRLPVPWTTHFDPDPDQGYQRGAVAVVVITHQMSVVEEICSRSAVAAKWWRKTKKWKPSLPTPAHGRTGSLQQRRSWQALPRMIMWCGSPLMVRPPQSRWWQVWQWIPASWSACSVRILVI